MRSLVIGASGGIGGALFQALQDRGPALALSRSDGLDVTDEATVRRCLDALEGYFDLIFVATGALGAPEKAVRAFDPQAFAAQMAVNAAGPLLVLKHATRLLPRGRPSVFAALSARVGSIGDNRLGGWYSYRASKAALNQLLRTASIELARTHRHTAVVALHPGTVDTGFTAGYGHHKVAADRAAANLLSVTDSLTAERTGGFFDYSGAEVPW